MAAHPTKTDALLSRARRGPVRARDLDALGIPRSYLSRLVARGALEQSARGVYRLPSAEATELQSLSDVSLRVPKGTICLLSALQVHGLTTEAPHAVWLMVDSRARTPVLDTVTLEVVRAKGEARRYGQEVREIEGVRVRITSPAKTVADCFRYRHRVGLDVAVAALRDFVARSRRRGAGSAGYSIDALFAAATADRVLRFIRPYVEALV